MTQQQSLFGSLFEEDLLLRTLGPIAYRPDIALTELVANAWDAGAAAVPRGDSRHPVCKISS